MSVPEVADNLITAPLSRADRNARPKVTFTALLWLAVAAAVVIFVARYSVSLAGGSVYVKQECRNVCAARFLATGQEIDSGAPVSLFQLPIVWFSGKATQAVDLFVAGRVYVMLLFWLNLALLALATGEKLLSPRGVMAVAGAATLFLFWNSGLEILEENLILTGLLLMWRALRVRPEAWQSFFIAGALTATLQFVSIWSLVYTLPLSLAALLFPPPAEKSARGKLALSWLSGAGVAAVTVIVTYIVAGCWPVYLKNWSNVAAFGIQSDRSWFWHHSLTQMPLLTALALAGVAIVVRELRNRGRAALSWSGLLPETVAFLFAAAVFVVSGQGFVFVVGFGFILAARNVFMFWRTTALPQAALVMIGMMVLFGHMIPFATAAQYNLETTNYRQEGLMRQAEEMTEPGKDFVFDEAGLVPTRRPTAYERFLWARNNPATKLPGLSDILAAQPAAIIIAEQYFDHLSKTDHDFISSHYVPLSDDYWVLGNVLPAGGGGFEIIHSGRYQITSAEASNIAGTYPAPKGLMDSLAPEPKYPPLTGTLDGKPFDGAPVELAAGTHQFTCAAGARVAVVWLGPSLDRIHRLMPGNHRGLLVKWL